MMKCIDDEIYDLLLDISKTYYLIDNIDLYVADFLVSIEYYFFDLFYIYYSD